MNINIKVYLIHRGLTLYKVAASLFSDFKKESDWTAAIAAYDWITQIKSSYAASEDFRIDQVI
ncbi:hypothetical protein [Peribacillus frigoritolerans]|uniref:hypothetical protein n=1 Tax=Peribacillus frigoritolerans TaxID=450367 RepID=UPI0020C0B1FB|nr:hypothetical protein [Peribacillus frigoritolerans]MEE3951604.1 hypothetical protein [Peribacillus frigoritolerans]